MCESFLRKKKVRPSKVYIHILVFVWFYISLTKMIFFRGRGRVWGQSKCTCAEWVSAFIKDWIQLHVLLYACIYHVVKGREFLNTFLVSADCCLCPLLIAGGISCLQKVTFTWALAWSWFWESEEHLGSDTWSAQTYIIVLYSVLILYWSGM